MNKKFSSSEKYTGLRRFYRFNVVFSAITLVLSLLSNLSTQMINKFGAEGQSVSTETGKGTASYEPPSFRIFSSIFVPEAKATQSVNIVLGIAATMIT